MTNESLSGRSQGAILLAHGEAEIRRSFRGRLEPDWKVVEVTSGAAALEHLRKRSTPQISGVLFAEDFADMEGEEFLAAWRNDATLATVPAIALLSEGSTRGLGWIRAGAQDYCKASISRDVFAELLEKTVTRHEAIDERAKSVVAIAENEDFLERVLDSLFAFVGVLSLEGRLTMVNEPPLTVAKLREEDVLGQLFWECPWWAFSESSARRVRESVGRALRGERIRYDAEIEVADGVRMWIDFQLAPLYNSQGEMTHLVPSGMDISERKLAEAHEHEVRQRLRAIYDGTREYMGLITTDGMVLEANRSSLVFGNAEPEDVVGQAFWECLWFAHTPGAPARVRKAVEQAATGEFVLIEAELTTPAGETRFFELALSPVFDESGDLLYIVPVGTDITNLKRVEMLLRDSDARVRLATETSAVGIWEWNVLTDALKWDAQMFEIYGLDPLPDGECTLSMWKDAILEEDLSLQIHQLEETIQTKRRSEREFRIFRAEDQTIRVIRSVETALCNDRGEVEWLIGSNLDITAQKRREANLAFIAELQLGFASRSTIEELMEFATSQVLTHMGVDRCSLFELHPGGKTAILLRERLAPGVAPCPQNVALEEFLTADELNRMRVGQTICVDNLVETDRSEGMKAAFRALNIGAVANATMLSGNRPKFLLHVSHSDPYCWRDDELELLTGLSPQVYLRLERAWAEEALRQSEEEMRGMFENTSIGIARLELDGGWETVNQRLCEITGYAENELLEKTFADITHPDDLESDLEQLGRLLSGEIQSYQLEKRYIKKNDTPVWINLNVSTISDDQGEPIKLVATVEDISAKRAAELALAKQRRFVERLADLVPGLLYVFDLETETFVFANRMMGEVAGTSVDELLESGPELLERLVHPDDRIRLPAYFESLKDAEDGGDYSLEYRFLRRDGSWRWYQSHDTPFSRDESGQVKEVLGIAADVTEQRENAEKLEGIAQRKDEFLAMLGHELRNPLGAIRHAIRLELEVHTEAKKRPWSLEVIDRQSIQLSRMIEDLLDVARVTQNKVPQHFLPLDLADVIERVADVGRSLIEQRELDLTVAIETRPLMLSGDAARLEQVFVNLLNNAVKYTPHGGKVTVQALQDAEDAVVRIEDTGMGIPEGQMSSLFELFHQAEPTLDRAEGGLGIGLTVVKSLVEAHGGSVQVKSPGAGLGSVFTVRLPLAKGVPQIEGHTEDPIPERGSRAPVFKVLIVDDHIDAAEGLARLLKLRGFDVEVAFDGEEGLAKAVEYQPAIFLLDLGLPLLDGYALAKALRKRSEFSESLMIAVSGYAQPADLERSKVAGFDHHFAKPLRLGDLLPLIANGGQNSLESK